MKQKIVIIYSVIHFLVDLACAILVTDLFLETTSNTITVFFGVIIYNFFAFAMQLPIGIIADKVNKNSICSAIGCILIAIAITIANTGIIACFVAGVGNAMFHIGGGIDILNISDKKSTLSGIFISTGAMGIFLGGMSNSFGFKDYYIIILMLIVAASVLIWLYNRIKDKVINNEVEIPNINKKEILAIICLIITVCIRGYVGLILSFEWKSNFILAFISIVSVVLGKMLGGIVSDKIGFRKISLISLIIAAICFIFAFKNSILGIIAILFFNMTMPITLTALSNILYNNRGMAFGLLTAALFIGAFPAFCGYTKELFTPIGLFSTTIISTIILYVGIKLYYEIVEEIKE